MICQWVADLALAIDDWQGAVRALLPLADERPLHGLLRTLAARDTPLPAHVPGASPVDADAVRILAQAGRSEAVQLYTLAALRQCPTAEDWPVALDDVVEALLSWQQHTLALDAIDRVRLVYSTERKDVAVNELEWLVEILYTLEIVTRLSAGEAVGPLLDAQPVTLNLERVALVARQSGQPQVRSPTRQPHAPAPRASPTLSSGRPVTLTCCSQRAAAAHTDRDAGVPAGRTAAGGRGRLGRGPAQLSGRVPMGQPDRRARGLALCRARPARRVPTRQQPGRQQSAVNIEGEERIFVQGDRVCR